MLNFDVSNQELSFHGQTSPRWRWSAEEVTEFLGNAVPLVRELDLRIVALSPERTVGAVSATPGALNQNGTLQASTFYILADNAIGSAFLAGLEGYTLDPRKHPGKTVMGWLKDGYVKHIRPASGEIRAHVEITPEQRASVLAELEATGKATCVGEARIHQGENLVAIARHTFVFLRK